MGLNRNDAYSGSFPHSGLGLTGGVVLMTMDVGLKFGVLNQDMVKIQDFQLGYKMVGFDVRWAFSKTKASCLMFQPVKAIPG